MIVRRKENKAAEEAREAAEEAVRAEHARKRALAEARKANGGESNSVQMSK
jgi:hypothetical protein